MRNLKALAILATLSMIAISLFPLVPASAMTGSRSLTDVTVTNIQLSQSIFFVGENITITATIDNLGTENATAVSVDFKAGNNSLPEIDIGTNSSIGDDNGGTNITNASPINVSMFWNTSEVGKQVQAGKVYSINITATNTTDGNASNNLMSVDIMFLDEHYLMVSEATPSEMTVMRGAPFNISWNVTNIGNKAQPALGDTLYLYKDNETTGINTSAIMDLAPKESKLGTFDIDTSGLSIGNHTFRLELFNTQRNITTDNITIIFPNIYVGEVEWEVIGSNATNVTVGEVVTINATIYNNGTANATGMYVAFFVDGSPTELGNDTVDVPMGGTNVSSILWNTTNETAGNHSVVASLKPIWDSDNSTGNITFEAGGVADLTITSLILDPTIVEIGDIVNITAMIKNIGDWPSEATNASFRFVKGLNSTNLGLVDFGALEPGQSTSVFYLWNTSGLEFWNYQIWVQLDPGGYVYEEVMTNNKANASLVLNAKPDLSVTYINMTIGQAEVTNVSQGETPTLNIVVMNIGTKNSETTRAAVYMDGSATPSATMKIFGLAVGGQYVLQYLWDTTTETLGNHTFTIIVDIDDNNTEIFEDNNELDFNVRVLEPKGLPDLLVDSISLSISNPKIGDHIVITTTVKNQGNADAVNATLLLAYESPGGNIEISKEVITLLALGQEIVKSITWTTGTLTSGNYTLNISIDSLNEIRESNRENNYKTISLFIAPSGAAAGRPDLKVVDIAIMQAKYKEGDMVDIGVIIKNVGDGEATNVRIVFYVDGIEQSTNSITTIAKNGATIETRFEWKATKGMHELKAEVYMGTSAVKDDQLSKVVTIKSVDEGTTMEYLPILLIIIVVIVIAIVLMARGGKDAKGEKGFIEEDHEEEEDYEEEE